MDHETGVEKVPVIYFGKENMEPGTLSWSKKCNEVRHCFEEYGCFVLVYDLIPKKLRDDLFNELEQLFDLPTETKAKHTSEMSLFGYTGKLPHLKDFEGIRLNETANLENVLSFSKLMWPHGNDNFCEIVHEHGKLLTHLDILLQKMVFESYNVRNQCGNHIESMAHILRFNKYPAVPEKDIETYVGLQPHTDKSFVSILLQNQISGLQVQTKASAKWLPVEFLPSSFIIIAGEAMTAWSNNKVHSPIHRVLMAGKETRYSVGTSSYHKGTIHIPEELIDEEYPRCYNPFNHLEFLSFYSKKQKEFDAGRIQSVSDIIKDFCGVGT